MNDLSDLAAETLGPRPFRADLHETGPAQHLGGPDVVLSHPGEQRPGRLDIQERPERGGGEPATPLSRVDPAGHLAAHLGRKAPDRPHEDSILVDRQDRAVRVVSDATVVGVERPPVGRSPARLNSSIFTARSSFSHTNSRSRSSSAKGLSAIATRRRSSSAVRGARRHGPVAGNVVIVASPDHRRRVLGHLVAVEVHVGRGLPSLTLTGLPGARVAASSRGREPVAGTLRKEGPGLDPPVAMGVLVATVPQSGERVGIRRAVARPWHREDQGTPGR